VGITARSVALLAFVSLAGVPLASPPSPLLLPPTALGRVLDGDTFEADLNADGRITPPQERIRLLGVDTPELHDNPKGLDLAHGLPAQAFLRQALSGKSLRLALPQADRHGRTLAQVWADGVWINQEIIAQGHSPLDTRFGLPDPADYPEWVRLEAAAFESRKGIWADDPSRRKYLDRLAREGRTPAAPGNPLWGGTFPGEGFDPARWEGKFVMLEAVLKKQRPLGGKGNQLLIFSLGEGRELAGFIRPGPRVTGPWGHWPVGSRLAVDGFITPYRGNLELVVHSARVISPGASPSTKTPASPLPKK